MKSAKNIETRVPKYSTREPKNQSAKKPERQKYKSAKNL